MAISPGTIGITYRLRGGAFFTFASSGGLAKIDGNWAADISYISELAAAAGPSVINVPSYNHSLPIRSRPVVMGKSLGNVPTGYAHLFEDPGKTTAAWYLDFAMPKDFFKLFGYPGVITITVEFFVFMPEAYCPKSPSSPVYKLDVSKFLVDAVLGTTTFSRYDRSFSLRQTVTGAFAYAGVDPVISIGCDWDGVTTGWTTRSSFYINMFGSYNAAFVDVRWDKGLEGSWQGGCGFSPATSESDFSLLGDP